MLNAIDSNFFYASYPFVLRFTIYARAIAAKQRYTSIPEYIFYMCPVKF